MCLYKKNNHQICVYTYIPVHLLLSRRYWHPSTPSGSYTSSPLNRCYLYMIYLINRPLNSICSDLLHRYTDEVWRKLLRNVTATHRERHLQVHMVWRVFFSVSIQNHLQYDSFFQPPDSFLIHSMIHFPLTEPDIVLRHMFVNGFLNTWDLCKYV